MLPDWTGMEIVTVFSPSTVFSYMMTASAPAGIGEPVMIRVAVPAVTGMVGTFPAGTDSSTRSVTGASSPAVCTSSARKA